MILVQWNAEVFVGVENNYVSHLWYLFSRVVMLYTSHAMHNLGIENFVGPVKTENCCKIFFKKWFLLGFAKVLLGVVHVMVTAIKEIDIESNPVDQ